MSENGRAGMNQFAHSIIARVILYYVGLATALILFWLILPQSGRAYVMGIVSSLIAFRTTVSGKGSAKADAAMLLTPDFTPPPFLPLMLVVIAVTSAFLLALPVAWVYMFTRQKKGYRPSDVHALVLMPVVVAGVVILVRDSLPLAFSLAGIVAAVRFKTTLEDSKDATFIFLATALGLACGVQLEVAAMMSVLFNTVVVILWYSDFARIPPSLEGVRAKR